MAERYLQGTLEIKHGTSDGLIGIEGGRVIRPVAQQGAGM